MQHSVLVLVSFLVAIWLVWNDGDPFRRQPSGKILSKPFNGSSDSTRSSINVNDNDPIVFHLIPHSHCDAAYKKTFDEYYETEVRNVLDSIVEAVSRSSSRRFVWAETIFLTKWWSGDPRTTSQQRERFRQMVASEQLEIVNGGWVMHDEGSTRYDAQIHQMTEGHDRLQQLLMDSLGRPNVSISAGWQIDPFGPSPFTVNLHAWAGMTVLVLNRMPDHVKDRLKANRSLQFYWEPRESSAMYNNIVQNSTRILVHVMDTHYASPDGFNWEDIEHGSPTQVTPYNVQERTDTFLKILMQRATYYQTPHVMVPMGGDFTFQNASMQFANMDRIMKFVKDHPERYLGAKLRFSTPNEYVRSVLQALSKKNQSLPTIHNAVDMQPLLAGYYFQNPNLKQMLRTCEMVLRSVEVQLFRALRENRPWEGLSNLVERTKFARRTVGLMQHHDAITATSYRFVIADYRRRLATQYNELSRTLVELTFGNINDQDQTNCAYGNLGKVVGGGNYLHESNLVRDAQSARSINLEKVVDPQMGMNPIELVVLNSWGIQVNSHIHFVCTRDDVAITLVQVDGSILSIPSQATPLENELETSSLGLFLISFMVSLDGLSERRFRVEVCDLTWNTFQKPQYRPGLRCADEAATMSAEELVTSGLSGPKVQVKFDPDTHDLASLTTQYNSDASVTTQLSHDFVLYDGTNDTVYSFATNLESSDPPLLLGVKPRQVISAYKGPLLSQVMLEYTPWLRVRYRVLQSNVTNTDSALQITVFVGQLPPNVNLASRLTTNSTTWHESEWYVEENGFMPVRVSYNSSSVVGDGNTRPLVSRTWIKSGEKNNTKKLTVFSVDPRAVVSKKDGELDVFWHRRNAYPGDWWREGNDRSSLVSSVWLRLTDTDKETYLEDRWLSSLLASDLVLLSAENSVPAAKITPHSPHTSFEIQGEDLPMLHILTLKVSQVDRDDKSRRNEAWLDVQIENLSENYLRRASLRSLLGSSSRIFWNSEGLLHSLTFLATFANDVDGEACHLETTNGGDDWILTVTPRRICSLRVPVSPVEVQQTTIRSSVP